MMSVQPLLPFADVPISCPTQAKYHAIAPCLAGATEPKQQAKLLNLSYSTVSRWLKQFREEGLAGLIPVVGHRREPYTFFVFQYLSCFVFFNTYFSLMKVI